MAQVAVVDGYPWRYKTPAFLMMFVLGAVVIWSIVGLVHAVVGRIMITTTVMVTGTVVLAVANYEKLRLRHEPLYPSDWEFVGHPGFLMSMIGFDVARLTVVTLVLGGCVLAGARVVRLRTARADGPDDDDGAEGHRGRLSRRHPVALRLVTGAACLMTLVYLSNFNSPSNVARATYHALGATWRPYSQERNYLGNGFVGGLLYNLDIPQPGPPAGYSATTMDRIVARYTAAAMRINANRAADGMADVNVVMALSESFSDPTALHGVHLGEDPVPFTRRLMRSTTSGPMLAQSVGGGTANMEFEALTGISASAFPAQLRVPYQMIVPKYSSFPSAVRWAKATGHRAIAIHPFTPEMYRRRDVYRTLGFDEFIYDRRLHDQKRIGHDAYISDAAAFAEISRQLANENEPVFLNVVTMQNHLPFAGRYHNPIPASGPDGTNLTDTGHYARGLRHSDRALQELIDALRELAEPTVLVLYGDHLPGTYPQSVIDANSTRVLHQTPFLVWANFPGSTAPQPVTSPTHFMDLVFELAGAGVPPYYALLTELRREVPAIENGKMFDAAGQPVRPGRLTTHAAQLIRDYRLVEYDISIGSRYSESKMFATISPTMRSRPGSLD